MEKCNAIIDHIINKPSCYKDDQAEYGIKYFLKKIQHIKVYFRNCEMRKVMISLKILSEKTNIESFSIIGGGAFAVNIMDFVTELKTIISKNKRLSKINEISLRRDNFNNKKVIEEFGAVLAGKNVINLILSANKIEKKQASTLLKILK